MAREKLRSEIFLTLNKPSREWKREAASAGIYETGGMKVPRLAEIAARTAYPAANPTASPIAKTTEISVIILARPTAQTAFAQAVC